MVQATAQDGGEFRPEIADVAVVIPAYNHSRFLAEAIESVLAQTLPVREIIVVDDASVDETSVIAARHERVRLVRQPLNRGLSESRNLGMRLAGARWLLFLDADDRLLPHAVAHSVACMGKNPDAGFVYGAHRRVDAELRPISGKLYHPLAAEPLCEFLQDNAVGMIATALFDRAKLIEVGGFDPALPRCEDYDLFLRLARRWPVACHDRLVAEYRIHGRNMSADAATMLQVALEVLERHRPPRAEREERRAYRQGRRQWASSYAHGAWRPRPGWPLRRLLSERLRMTMIAPGPSAFAAAAQFAKRVLPDRFVARLRPLLRHRLDIGSAESP